MICLEYCQIVLLDYIGDYHFNSSLKDFNIFVLKFSSLLVGLVPFGWLGAGDGIENDLVALVVGIADVVCGAADCAISLIHTALETKWYPDGQVPPGSGRSTMGMLLLLLLPLPVLLLVCCGNCDKGVGDADGEYNCCAYT